jgi:hypothetical protein
MKRAIPMLMVARWTESTFSPIQISGLKLWLKADSLVLSDNDPVSTWSDSSGNANDVTAAGSARPTYKTNIQNGLPAVRFDGTSDVLTGTFTFDYGTILAVCNFNSAGNFPNYNGLVVTQNGALGSDDLFTGDGSGTTNLYNAGGLGPFGNNIWINAVQMLDFSPLTTTKLIAGVDSTPLSKTSINIGNDPAAGSRFWNGDVLEVIIYDTALSDANRIRVQDYLIAKWAL